MAWCRSEETHGEENSSIKAHIGVTPKCADDGRFSENSSIKAHIGVTAKCADDGRFSENSSIKAHIGVTAKCADDGRFSENSSIKAHIGVIASCTVAGLLVALHAVAGPFIAPALRKVCLPFVPATATQVKNVMNVLQARSGSLVDIGSGDGRIVIAAAKAGFRAAGFELNPWLVWYSRYRAWREGVSHCTSFHIADLWKVSFSQYSNVVIFGVPQMMEQLEAKLQSELRTSAMVVVCRFPFPTWTPECGVGEGIDTVWVYHAKTFKSQEKTAETAEQL